MQLLDEDEARVALAGAGDSRAQTVTSNWALEQLFEGVEGEGGGQKVQEQSSFGATPDSELGVPQRSLPEDGLRGGPEGLGRAAGGCPPGQNTAL